MITRKNYIGNTLSAIGNKTFKTFNPLLNIENQWGITEASTDEVNDASDLTIYRWFLPLLELDINPKLVQNIKYA